MPDQSPPYIPDFTVRPATDCQVLIITRSQYIAACTATKFEQKKRVLNDSRNDTRSDVFAQEWERAVTQDSESFGGSGLPPISRKKPAPKRQGVRKQLSVEHRPLLNRRGGSSATSSNVSESTDDEEAPTYPVLHHSTENIELGVLRSSHLPRDGTGANSASPPSSNSNRSPLLPLEMQDFPDEPQLDYIGGQARLSAEAHPRSTAGNQALAYQRTSSSFNSPTSSDL